jgi:hypothetical protein
VEARVRANPRSRTASPAGRDHPVRSARSGASGLLAGGLALLGLAAVPISPVVTDAFTASGGEAGATTRSVATASTHLVPRTESHAGAGVTVASDDESEPAPPAPDTAPAAEESPSDERTRWDRLADCEAGDWDADGRPIPGTARWDYGIDFTHEGYELFQGGLNFHPETWDEFRDADMPDHAGRASREEEIVVGERVLAAQGWEAWPVCSEMIGLS